ncbi:unnamed protein product [Pedinophyceae sp. YPF-701]|nr:unnamed protein product [Pedinophyceae sp. YPF-701]
MYRNCSISGADVIREPRFWALLKEPNNRATALPNQVIWTNMSALSFEKCDDVWQALAKRLEAGANARHQANSSLPLTERAFVPLTIEVRSQPAPARSSGPCARQQPTRGPARSGTHPPSTPPLPTGGVRRQADGAAAHHEAPRLDRRVRVRAAPQRVDPPAPPDRQHHPTPPEEDVHRRCAARPDAPTTRARARGTRRARPPAARTRRRNTPPRPPAVRAATKLRPDLLKSFVSMLINATQLESLSIFNCKLNHEEKRIANVEDVPLQASAQMVYSVSLLQRLRTLQISLPRVHPDLALWTALSRLPELELLEVERSPAFVSKSRHRDEMVCWSDLEPLSELKKLRVLKLTNVMMEHEDGPGDLALEMSRKRVGKNLKWLKGLTHVEINMEQSLEDHGWVIPMHVVRPLPTLAALDTLHVQCASASLIEISKKLSGLKHLGLDFHWEESAAEAPTAERCECLGTLKSLQCLMLANLRIRQDEHMNFLTPLTNLRVLMLQIVPFDDWLELSPAPEVHPRARAMSLALFGQLPLLEYLTVDLGFSIPEDAGDESDMPMVVPTGLTALLGLRHLRVMGLQSFCLHLLSQPKHPDGPDAWRRLLKRLKGIYISQAGFPGMVQLRDWVEMCGGMIAVYLHMCQLPDARLRQGAAVTEAAIEIARVRLVQKGVKTDFRSFEELVKTLPGWKESNANSEDAPVTLDDIGNLSDPRQQQDQDVGFPDMIEDVDLGGQLIV